MSTEENSNNIETIPSSINPNSNDNNSQTKLKDQFPSITNEQKIKELKRKLKNLLQKTLGKSLLNLETNNQNQLQILNVTTKSYKEFDNKINIMKSQVEENIKKKEENKKIKKNKTLKAKFRSRTSQKSNKQNKYELNLNNESKIKDSNRNPNNESSKSLIKIRAKTEGKNNNRILNSEKKSYKNKNNISIKADNNNNNNILYSTIKLNKSSSIKLNSNEQSNNKNKKKLNNDNIINNNSNKTSKKNIKERKNSKDIKNSEKENISRTKLNIRHKSQYDLKSSNSNLLSNSKEKQGEEKIAIKNINKKLLINKKNLNVEYRKSFDFSNKKIPKPKINNYIKKNTEILTEKKSSSKKNFLNNKKPKNTITDCNLNKNQENKKTEEDTDTIIERFEKKKELLEKIRKQREEIKLREEAKKKELEKEQEEEKKREEERKKRDLKIKRREEQRKKELEEKERKKDEERKKKQMEIEAKIQKEKIEKENMKKEMEKQKELEKQKKLEEERMKKEEIEKFELEMDKIKEEEVKELPNNIELNIGEKNENIITENKNKELNIQDLLELEEKNDQNFEYFHIKEEIEKDILLVTPEKKEEEKEEIKNDINDNNENEKEKEKENINVINNTPEKLYREISILELIHDVPNFSPILFEFLSFEELLGFTSISKKIKRQRIYIFNLQKTKILKNIGMENEQNLVKKINEYEENYSNNELNEPYIEFHLSRGAARAIQLLNNNKYSKIFRRPVLDNNLSQIYIAYRILFIFLNEVEIANISDDKLFWVKCTEYLNSKGENGKIGDFILSKFEKFNCDSKTIYYIEQIMKGKKDNMSPSYFSKICGSTGLLIFLIKELMEYCGVIVSTKKTQLSRIYQNLKYFKNIIDKLSDFNKTLENFSY